MKQPYWIINKETIKAWQKSDWSLFKLIYVWIRVQLHYFYSLNFKSCKKDHFWNKDLFCIRCKKSIRDIDKKEVENKT